MDNLLHTILLMLEGTQVTLEIFCITLVLALPIGLLAALGRISSLKPVSLLMELYVWVMRGTPLMLQLLFVYFALPMVGVKLPDIAAALLAFTLNYAAYFAEIFRAGIQSLDKGQMEAARSVGMTYWQAMFHIILPQAFRRMLPPLGNNAIAILKDSSLVSAIGLAELAYAARTVAGATARYWEPYITISLMYWVMTLGLAYLVKKMEQRLGKGDDNR